MERKEPRKEPRKEQRGGGGQQAQPAEQCEGEQGSPPAAVVQRTRVVLLAGEPWGSAEGCAGAPAVLSSFQHQVLPAAATAVSCRRPVQGRRGTTAAGLGVPPNIDEEGEPPTPTPPAPSAPASAPPPPGGQLTFFLCRASSLRERAERLREVLRGVRDQRCGAPAALVGVLVQPRPEEEQGALARLEQLLRDVFQAEGGSGSAAAAAMEMHTAVFAPGRPDGALELKRLDQRRPPTREAAGEEGAGARGGSGEEGGSVQAQRAPRRLYCGRREALVS
uniref:Uncharacterized protein n=1 Tax=Salvator merianae TaxID=96440 RepID=A0A8D0BWQ3_SALMN